MATDAEIRKTYSVALGESDIIYMVVKNAGKDSKKEIRRAQLMLDELLEILKQKPDKKFLAIVDLSGLKAFNPPGKLRDIYMKTAANKQVEKIGIVTKSAVVKTIGMFFMQAAGRSKDINFFNKKEKALEWLKKKQ